MKLLIFLIDLLKRFLKGITYDWIVALIAALKAFLKWLKSLCGKQPDHSDVIATETGCAQIDHPSFHRPDPTIYSQDYLTSLGLAVTWDNPDISLFLNGVQADEGALLANTEYEIRATIWNNSFDAPIVSLPVKFGFLSFGVTTVLNAIGSTVVNLGVKGGAHHPAVATMRWITPPAGHYCLDVTFEWVDDANPRNNHGQNNTNVVQATSPATFSFKLRNPDPKEHRYRMVADTYTLPEREECKDAPLRKLDNAQKWKLLQGLHNRNNHPVPAGWTVVFTPATASLQPDEEIDVQVEITPPNDFSGRKAFNVHAVNENGIFTGGVTVYVEKA